MGTSDLTPLEAAEKLESTSKWLDDKEDFGCGQSAMRYAASLLRQIAAGEYKQVVHAHWLKRDIFEEDPLECSNCHNSVSVFGYEICPSCGALMDESREGNSLSGKDDSHE